MRLLILISIIINLAIIKQLPNCDKSSYNSLFYVVYLLRLSLPMLVISIPTFIYKFRNCNMNSMLNPCYICLSQIHKQTGYKRLCKNEYRIT